MNYNPYDISISQRNAYSSSFVEIIISAATSSVIAFDENKELITIPISSFATGSTSTISASYAVSASWAPQVASDFSISSSWASQSLSSSYAVSASWAPQVASDFSISSSWASQSLSSSYVPNLYPQTYQASGSWSSSSFSSISSSYASTSTSASYVPNLYPQIYQESGSWASQSLVSISSSFASQSISSSWAPVQISSSWASQSLSSSFSSTSSYFNIFPRIKSGILSSSAFGGSPFTTSVTFLNPFSTTQYSITIIGGDARIWTTEIISSSNFIISSNSNQPLTDYVRWVVIGTGESP